jgi:hypothetical protein
MLARRQPKKGENTRPQEMRKEKQRPQKRNGQTLVARRIKLSSPSRHVEGVALHLANAGVRSDLRDRSH